MGFEVKPDCAVAHLDDQPTTVQQSSVRTHSAQVPMKPGNTTAKKLIVTPVTSRKASGACNTDAKVSAADGSQQSLYEIIRQRSQLSVSTQKEQSTSSVGGSSVTQNSGVEGTQHPQNEPFVKFCLENNAFISASSAEESQCR